MRAVAKRLLRVVMHLYHKTVSACRSCRKSHGLYVSRYARGVAGVNNYGEMRKLFDNPPIIINKILAEISYAFPIVTIAKIVFKNNAPVIPRI